MIDPAAFYDHPTSPKPTADPITPPADTLLTTPNVDDKAPPADPGAAEAAKQYPSMQEKAPADGSRVPENIRTLRAEDTERKHFSPQTMLKDAIPDDALADVVGALPDGTSISDEHRAAAVSEWREIAADMSMASEEVKAFSTVYREAIANPPTPEQDAQWRNESVKLLKERYGQRAHSLLGLADKLVKRDPRAQALIKHGKIGNHPKVVLSMVEAALRESTKGRLK